MSSVDDMFQDYMSFVDDIHHDFLTQWVWFMMNVQSMTIAFF